MMRDTPRLMVLGIDLCEFDPATDGELRDEQVLVVFSSDFDRVTAERNALQQRLNAADQRTEDANDLMRRALAVIDGQGWSEFEADVREFIHPTLKPTESGASDADRKADDEALQRRHDQERQEYFNDESGASE